MRPPTSTRGRRRGRRVATVTTVAAVTAGLILTGAGFSPASAASASATLVVNAGQVIRPVTHVATGSLYGLATASQPTLSLAQAIKPHTFVQMPQGGKQQPYGDISVVAPTAVSAGAKLVNRFSDYYAGWPYQFSWSTWTPFINSQVSAMKSSPYYNSISAYELWNESDNTWKSSNGTYEEFWTRTFRQVRSIDPNKPIQGPSFSDNISDMRKFLQNAKATNTVPDIIAWHELIRSSKIAGDVATVNGILDELGISRRPIAIEEYAAPSEVGLPGPLVGYISKFERLGIRDAELAFWNQSGTLGDLLTSRGGSPNAAYWLYTWYGAMSGNMVATTPPAQTGIDGFAAVPSAKNQLSVVVGGCNGSCAVQVNGLSSLSLGSTVNVKVEQTRSLGRTVASPGPSTVSNATYTPSNGSINVPISMATNDAYRITVTPGSGSNPTDPPSGSIDTNAWYVLVNRNSGKALDVYNLSTADGAPIKQWSRNNGNQQQWQFTSVGNGYYKVKSRLSGKVLDVTAKSTADGAVIEQWTDNDGANQQFSIQTIDGYIQLIARNSGKAVEVQGASTVDGGNVVQYSDWNGTNQQWQLVKVG